jgi:glucose 1-dehydrogenase
VQRLIASTVDGLGGLDVLVNNAGIDKQVPLLQMSLTEWDLVLRTPEDKQAEALVPG